MVDLYAANVVLKHLFTTFHNYLLQRALLVFESIRSDPRPIYSSSARISCILLLPGVLSAFTSLECSSLLFPTHCCSSLCPSSLLCGSATFLYGCILSLILVGYSLSSFLFALFLWSLFLLCLLGLKFLCFYLFKLSLFLYDVI